MTEQEQQRAFRLWNLMAGVFIDLGADLEKKALVYAKILEFLGEVSLQPSDR